MKSIPYTFSVIRYVHDRAAGEVLNIGVLVYAPTVGFADFRYEPRFERLSRTFGGFDGDGYRRTVRRFEDAIKSLRLRLGELAGLSDVPMDASGVVSSIWADSGLSFESGPVMGGLSNEPMEHLVGELFARMVSSQAPAKREEERRTDDEVWTVYQRTLRHRKVSHLLAPKVFTAPEFEIEFDHAFQNNKWHVVQPVTMDFVKRESLQEKATRWLGNATALNGHPQLGKLYVVLGEPQIESHRSAYVKAKNLLHKMPIAHELVDEHDAEAFAAELESYMREHGVISSDPTGRGDRVE